MVEQQRRISLPPGYKPPSRGPSRTRVLVRRLAALGLFVAVAAGGFLLLRGAIQHDAAPPPPPPAPKALRIIFPEGFTRTDMAQRIDVVNGIALRKRRVRSRLSPSAYLRLTERSQLPGGAAFARDNNARSLEGFLFPDTYEFNGKTTTRELVRKQVANFKRQWAEVDLGYATSHNLNGYDVLRIASLIEKEAVLPRDRARVSTVIYNRLRRRIPLGVDASLRYGLHLPGTKPLGPYVNSTNPYNTRKYPGLPPTPIANPGLASIRAAAKPAKGCWLYFLAYPDKKRTYFTCSFRDFVNHERQWGYIR